MGAGLFLAGAGWARGGDPPRSWLHVPVLRARVVRRALAPVAFAAVALPTLRLGVREGTVGSRLAVLLAVAVVAVLLLGLSGIPAARRELRRVRDGQAARWPYQRDGSAYLLLSPLDRRSYRVHADPTALARLPERGALWVRGEILGGPASLEADDGTRLWLLDGGARIVDH